MRYLQYGQCIDKLDQYIQHLLSIKNELASQFQESSLAAIFHPIEKAIDNEYHSLAMELSRAPASLSEHAASLQKEVESILQSTQVAWNPTMFQDGTKISDVQKMFMEHLSQRSLVSAKH